MKLTFFDVNDEPSIKMRKNPKTLTLFDDIESRSLFTKGINDSPENDLNNKNLMFYLVALSLYLKLIQKAI